MKISDERVFQILQDEEIEELKNKLFEKIARKMYILNKIAEECEKFERDIILSQISHNCPICGGNNISTFNPLFIEVGRYTHSNSGGFT